MMIILHNAFDFVLVLYRLFDETESVLFLGDADFFFDGDRLVEKLPVLSFNHLSVSLISSKDFSFLAIEEDFVTVVDFVIDCDTFNSSL